MQTSNAYKPEPLPYTSQTEDEYLPALSPDGSILFFTRARNENSEGMSSREEWKTLFGQKDSHLKKNLTVENC